MTLEIPENQTFEEVMSSLDGFIKTMTVMEQLHFWRLFRTVHRDRIAKTQAPLCPDLLAALDKHIEQLLKEV